MIEFEFSALYDEEMIMKKTKLTVIVDNIPQGDIKGEWGLSILVEYEDKKILVDAGASGLFAENMKKLGFCIGDVDYATLSHAHYDHANGMVWKTGKQNSISEKEQKKIVMPRNSLSESILGFREIY